MLEGYKVLKAIEGSGGTFTAAEIADRTGITLKTVKTAIWRNSALLERDSTEKSGGRGRPAVRYRVRAEAVKELRDRLAAVELALAPVVEEHPVPTALLAAEEMLADPVRRPAEQQLAFAGIGLQRGKDALAERPSSLIAAHVQAVEALILLVQLTLEPAEDPSRGRVAAARTRVREAEMALRQQNARELVSFVESSARLLAALA